MVCVGVPVWVCGWLPTQKLFRSSRFFQSLSCINVCFFLLVAKCIHSHNLLAVPWELTLGAGIWSLERSTSLSWGYHTKSVAKDFFHLANKLQLRIFISFIQHMNGAWWCFNATGHIRVRLPNPYENSIGLMLEAQGSRFSSSSSSSSNHSPTHPLTHPLSTIKGHYPQDII